MAARRGHAQVREGEPILEEYARWPGDAALHTGLGFHRESAEPLVLVDRSGVRLRLDVRDERTSADPHIRAKWAGVRAPSIANGSKEMPGRVRDAAVPVSR